MAHRAMRENATTAHGTERYKSRATWVSSDQIKHDTWDLESQSENDTWDHERQRENDMWDHERQSKHDTWDNERQSKDACETTRDNVSMTRGTTRDKEP